MLLSVLLLLVLTVSACSSSEHVEEANVWDCTVSCAEQSTEENYVITYSDEEVVSSSGALTFQNRNAFDVSAHLFNEGGEEVIFNVPAGGVTTFYRAEKGDKYAIGLHAEVEAGTEIKLVVYDGERADVWQPS